MMLTIDRIAKKKNPPEMNMLSKNARNNKMTIKSLYNILDENKPRVLYWGGGGYSGSLQNWLVGGGGGTSCISNTLS